MSSTPGSSATGPDAESSGDTTSATTTSGRESDDTGSDTDTSADSDTDTDTDTDTEGTSTGGVLPFDCDDGQAPVRVVDGGSYDTLAEGVEAAPPDGVVQVCPGQYTGNIQLERSVTIHGAGADLVTVDGGAAATFLWTTNQATSVRMEGMTLENGTYGLFVDWPNEANGEPVLELEDMHITGSQRIGLSVQADDYFGTVELVGTTIDDVVGGMSIGSLQVGGAIHLRRITATLTDCVLENNVAQTGGGMFLAGADVTFTGGRVVSNTAVEGGGASLITTGFPGAPVPATLTIEDSDWGAGAADENQDTDVWCDAVSDAAGFLGSPTNAVCTSNGSPCCL